MKIINTYIPNVEAKIEKNIQFVLSAKTDALREQRLNQICNGCKRHTCTNCQIEGALQAERDAERRVAARRHKIAIA